MTALPLIFGEVLFDHFPDDETVLGGAPFNVAWHLQAFGAKPMMITRIGDDPQGQRIVDAMHAWGMDDAGVQHDATRHTGRVDVDLSQGEPRYDIRTDAAFDAIAAEELPPLGAASLLYHGTLALRDDTCRTALDTLKQFSGAPVFLDVNLRSPWWNKAQVLELVSRARWVKLNAEELDLLAGPDGDVATRARALDRRLGPEPGDRHPGRQGCARGGCLRRGHPTAATARRGRHRPGRRGRCLRRNHDPRPVERLAPPHDSVPRTGLRRRRGRPSRRNFTRSAALSRLRQRLGYRSLGALIFSSPPHCPYP